MMSPQAAGRVDHVVVGEDVALAVEDEAGAGARFASVPLTCRVTTLGSALAAMPGDAVGGAAAAVLRRPAGARPWSGRRCARCRPRRHRRCRPRPGRAAARRRAASRAGSSPVRRRSRAADRAGSAAAGTHPRGRTAASAWTAGGRGGGVKAGAGTGPGVGDGRGPGGHVRAVRARVRRGYRGAVRPASGPGAVRGVRAPRARGRRTAGCCTHRARAVASPPVRGRGVRAPCARRAAGLLGCGGHGLGAGLRAPVPRTARASRARVPRAARAPPARAVRVCPRPARPRPVHPPRRPHSPAPSGGVPRRGTAPPLRLRPGGLPVVHVLPATAATGPLHAREGRPSGNSSRDSTRFANGCADPGQRRGESGRP